MSARHSWVHLKVHVYICQKCGCGKVNEGEGRSWRTKYHRPYGTSEYLQHTPPCEVGPLTEKYLAKYQAAIVLWADRKATTAPEEVHA